MFCEHGVGGKESVVGEGSERRGIRTQAQNPLSGRGEGLGKGDEAGRLGPTGSPARRITTGQRSAITGEPSEEQRASAY